MQPVQDLTLEALLPHARPMILLSGIAALPGDNEVEAYVDVTEDSPFYDFDLGGVPAYVGIEYMAQATALLAGYAAKTKGEPVRMGFLLGTRKLVTTMPAFAAGSRYRVTSRCVYDDEEFGSFECAVKDARGATVATAALTAYRPADTAAAMAILTEG